MSVQKSTSEEQKKYVAAVCPEYTPHSSGALSNKINGGDTVSCDSCIHWDNGKCVIFDDVLTGIDQT